MMGRCKAVTGAPTQAHTGAYLNFRRSGLFKSLLPQSYQRDVIGVQQTQFDRSLLK